MEQKNNEIIVNGKKVELNPKGMTITQLPCATKKEAIKLFNQLKKTRPAHYQAALVKYSYPSGDIVGGIMTLCPYYMIVSQYQFSKFCWIKDAKKPLDF